MKTAESTGEEPKGHDKGEGQDDVEDVSAGRRQESVPATPQELSPAPARPKPPPNFHLADEDIVVTEISFLLDTQDLIAEIPCPSYAKARDGNSFVLNTSEVHDSPIMKRTKFESLHCYKEWWYFCHLVGERRLGLTTQHERLSALLLMAATARQSHGLLHELRKTALLGLRAALHDASEPIRRAAVQLLAQLCSSEASGGLAIEAAKAVRATLRDASCLVRVAVPVVKPRGIDAECLSSMLGSAQVEEEVCSALRDVTKPSELDRNPRLLMMSDGTRGDVEPLTLLANQLQARSWKIRALVRANLVGFCTARGVDAIPVFADFEEMFQMAGGISNETLMELGKAELEWKQLHPDILVDVKQAMKEFQPDIIVWSGGGPVDVTSVEYENATGTPSIGVIGWGVDGALVHKRGITSRLPLRPCFVHTSPAIDNAYSGKLMPGVHHTGAWLPSAQPQPAYLEGLVEFLERGPAPVAVGWGSMYALGFYPRGMVTLALEALHRARRRGVIIGGWTRLHEIGPDMVSGVLASGVSERVVDGVWRMTASKGKDFQYRFWQDPGQEAFGGHQLPGKKITDASIRSSELKWTVGSVTCKARLSDDGMQLLDGSYWNHVTGKTIGSFTGWRTEMPLRLSVEAATFARDNCLFVASAPNSWLFPRCSCVVHHGGAGTTHAALSAGVPTVVTPVAFDQFQWSQHVRRLGVGVGFAEALPKISAKDLAAAITKAEGSDCTVAVKALSAKLKADVGVAHAAEVLRVFMEREVMSGHWKQRHNALEERQRCL